MDAELAKFKTEEGNAKANLEKLLQSKWKEQNISFQRQVKKLRCDMMAKQEMQREQLLARHKKRMEDDKSNLAKGLQWLTKKHADEIQEALASHQE
eukprot:3881077-Ditylum_brightwellii.AAC.1